MHRALPDALTCARVFCALFPKLCANAVTVGDALDLLRSRRRARKTRAAARRSRPTSGPDLSTLPDDPGVYIFRDERGRPLYVGKSVSLRSRARAHFCAPAGWTERAEIVDYRPTNSELGALVLENRLIKQWKPGGNKALKRTDRYCYLRCRLDIPYPVLEVARRARRGPRGEHRAAGEPRRSRGARRPAHVDVPAAPLRAQAEGARAPVGVRADGPLRVALPGRPRSERVPPPARPGARRTSRSRRGRGIDRGARRADARRRERRSASSGRRRCCGGRSGWRGWSTGSRACCAATHAEPRLVLAKHPVKERFDAFWIVQGRLVDWGPLPGPAELAERTEAALSRSPRAQGDPGRRDRRDPDRGELGRGARAAGASARSAAERARTTRIYGRSRGRGRLIRGPSWLGHRVGALGGQRPPSVPSFVAHRPASAA